MWSLQMSQSAVKRVLESYLICKHTHIIIVQYHLDSGSLDTVDMDALNRIKTLLQNYKVIVRTHSHICMPTFQLFSLHQSYLQLNKDLSWERENEAVFYHLISDSSEDICEGQPIFSRQLHICIEHAETYELVEKEGVLEVLTVWQYLQEHPISDSATCRKPQMRYIHFYWVFKYTECRASQSYSHHTQTPANFPNTDRLPTLPHSLNTQCITSSITL